MVRKDLIWQALRTVRYPGYDRDIVSFGLVQRVAADETGVTVTLAVGHLAPEVQRAIVAEVQRALAEISNGTTVRVEVSRPGAVRRGRGAVAKVVRPSGIRSLIAVGSGKGGVGKSTVAVNLAVALAQRGFQVGLMDADAYGPNDPRMLGVDRLPRPKHNRLVPAEAYGVRLISIGLLVRPEQALIWRGPMTDTLIRQFFTDVAWGDLDVLVVDLPPGTGDIALSLVQRGRPDGAVLVVTPQDVALEDALKAAHMFQELHVPILGVVENMSYFVCDHCGKQHHLFGSGGGARLARTLNVPLLEQVPFEPAVREGGDEGLPAVLRPDSAAGKVFKRIADLVGQFVETKRAAVPQRA